MFWRIEQITSRFLAIVVSVTALMALLVAGIMAWRQFETERRRQDTYVAEIARLSATALADPMWAINDRATRAITVSLIAHPEIACAEVLAPDGSLVAATAGGGCKATPNTEPVVQSVVTDGHVLGDLIIWVRRDALPERMRANAQLTVLVFLLLSGAMVVTAVFALRATVMKPLERLIEAIRVAGKVPANPRPKDELGRVISAYNSLLDRVEAHTAEIEEARAQAVAAAQAKSRFLATMSHEIRTPMHGVLGTVELLRETALTAEQRKYANVILHSTEGLLGIINDILDLSKIEAGKVRMALAPVNPSHIVQEVIGSLSATALGKDLSLHMVTEPDVPAWIMADGLRLRQVLMNLVGNGVKFTEAGSVTIGLKRFGGRLVIEVVDTGIGIAPDLLPRLFKPFQQGDASTTRRHGGTGLGLSISHQLVELMGGVIEVESGPLGSAFRVLLPLTEACAPQAGPAAPATPGEARGARVLVAEDNPVNQWLLRSQLERLGYQADIHGDGNSALAAFRSGTYQAVVTDYHMPIMDGLDLARAIRKEEVGTGQRIPLVGVTADAFTETTEECLRAGMDEVVTKPVSLDELGAVLGRRIAGLANPSRAARDQDPQDDAPLLDPEVTAAVLGDDPAARTDIAELFGSTVDACLSAIRDALEARQAEALKRSTHSLASAALSLGAARLGLAARALEHAAGEAEWSRLAEMTEHVAALDRQTRKALARESTDRQAKQTRAL